MATIEQLPSDYLREVLLRVPLADFIKNVKLVSRQFYAGAESAFNEKIEQDPIEFSFSCHCAHFPPLAGPPHVYLANVLIPVSKLMEVAHSSLLPFVSKVYLSEFCEKSSGFVPQLKAIMDKINDVCDVRFVFRDYAYYGNSSARHADRLIARGPMREAAFVCANVLRNTKSLILKGPRYVASTYSRGDKMDFLQALHFTEQLTSLRVPTSIFALVVPQANRVFANLQVLRLSSIEQRFHSINLNCQDIIATVCDNCPNLSKFEYDCEYTQGQGCLFDLSPLIKLTNLRSLTLCLREIEFRRNHPLAGQLPLVEFLKLNSLCKVQEFCAILRMFPNVKELHFVEISDLRSLYEEMRAMLISGQLAQLRAMRITARWAHRDCYFESYTDIHLLTEIQSAVPLRRLDFDDHYARGIILGTLPDGHLYRCAPAPTLDVPRFIRQTNNVTQLLLYVDWMSDGYQALAEVLVAMQEGSVQQLAIRSGWRDIAKRNLEAALPTGCHLHEVVIPTDGRLMENRTEEILDVDDDHFHDNDNIFDFILIRGRKSIADLDCQFWVRLVYDP